MQPSSRQPDAANKNPSSAVKKQKPAVHNSAFNDGDACLSGRLAHDSVTST